jgi:hypothetical protein
MNDTVMIEYANAPISAEKVAMAQKSDFIIRESDVALNKRSMQIGWHGAFLKNNNLFKYVGYENEDSYKKSLKVGKSTWHRMIRLANGFPNLDEDTFLKMTADNADLLIEYISEEDRDSNYWIDLASTRTYEELEQVIIKQLGLKDHLENKEVFVPFKMGMLEGQKDVIEQGIKEFQAAHGIESPAKALELIVAETSGKKTLVGFLIDSLTKLRSAIDLTESDVDPESAIPRIKEILEDYITGLAESLEIAQQ